MNAKEVCVGFKMEETMTGIGGVLPGRSACQARGRGAGEEGHQGGQGG
jgi:hypothetical protein